MLSHSVVSDFATSWTIAQQAPLSTEFSRQEYWSVFPFPIPGYLTDLGIDRLSPTLAGRFFITVLPGKPNLYAYQTEILHLSSLTVLNAN